MIFGTTSDVPTSKSYNCFTCQEPLKINVLFHTYIRKNGPQKQKCMHCGAVHDVDEKNNVRLAIPGTQMAKLSMEYPYPEHKPYRTGPYRVRYSNGNWSRALLNWNGEHFHNGPVLLREGSIIAWQGLAGDMEHHKRMPYDHVPPVADMPEGDDS